MIDGHDEPVSLGHATFDEALLARFNLDDLGADLVGACAVTHEYVRHIVGDLASDGVSILDGYGFAGPFQHRVIVVTEHEKRMLPA